MSPNDPRCSGASVPDEVIRSEFAALSELRDAPRYQHWIVESFVPMLEGRVLEVGPGNGNFTRFIAPLVEAVTAVEPEPLMADAVTGLAIPNVEVVPETIEAMAGSERRWNVAVLLNVLEHIEDDLGALRTTVSLLEPGGHVCVLVPAHQALFGSLDTLYGHYRRYSLGDVRRLLETSGLRLLRCRYFNPLGAIGWLLVARVRRAKEVPGTAILLTERIGVPLGRLLERLGPPPFGQSVVAIGQRR